MTSTSSFRIAALACLAWQPATAQPSDKLPPPASIRVDFDRDVNPILQAKCHSCHGRVQQQSGLRLDRAIPALRGGDYGKVIVPGNSAESRLILRLVGADVGIQMPPTGPLPPEEISILRAWIDQGVEWSQKALSDDESAPAAPLNPRVRSLLEAIRQGNTGAVRAMLDRDKALAAAKGPEGATALMYAALFAGEDLMALLLDRGADPNARNDGGATALLFAAGDPAKARLLLARGADVNARSALGKTPLLVAATHRPSTDTVRLLLEKGADVGARDINGTTPLIAAAAAGNQESLTLLIGKGADVNAKADSGATALIAAAGARCLGCVQLLLARGAGVKAATKRGATALSVAAGFGALDIVRILLEKGADVHTRDDRGYTPLMYAAYSESVAAEVVKALLDKGADPQASGEGETVLSLAKKRGDTPVLRLLLKANGL